uniref:Protein kinase domain-containing protein n=1 Tax=Chromera velia CCMP2878 TaxID=1169474 RepID=A0A0G4G1Q6_9ALVE|eukprot:Cvel_4047.t1-p1 / transcript=Cvel_4047.t1 / gene=Cvel_4047 / organism=Chromera_velia_CCMP2878 / gene_product=CBL-interacting serine/threonine-protein kinase 5, putative / transcript_product=CBL-interacting serine/threonine-protein kinase 5, putative / location=Cvel_scaffold172:48962-58327(-) / protein_length=1968 / sequence_SO=supercontig / SO=protein_coding / is_pseudo=false
MPPIEIPPVLTGNLEQYRLQCLYGCVFKGVALTTGAVVAIKIFSKSEIAKKESETDLPETPLAEVFFATLTASASEYLTTPREVFHDENFHFVVSDFARGEDLLELLKLFPQGMPEPQAKFYIRQATEALMECHRRDFAMQDFSLENCLLFKKGERGGPFYFSVRVCDPGQAILFRRNSSGRELRVPYRGCVGKKFRPPEVFKRKPYMATKIDSWDLGWACHYLLFARQIVGSCDDRDQDWRYDLFRRGRIRELMSRNEISKPWTNEALDFILRLMRIDPSERMDIADALKHPWLDPNHALSIEFFDLRPKCTVEQDLILQAHLRKAEDKECDAKVKSIQERIKQGPVIPEAYRKEFMKQLCLYYKPSGHTLGQLEGLRESIALPDRRTAAAEPLLSLSTIPKDQWTKIFNPPPAVHSYNGAVLTFPKTPVPVYPPPLFPDQVARDQPPEDPPAPAQSPQLSHGAGGPHSSHQTKSNVTPPKHSPPIQPPPSGQARAPAAQARVSKAPIPKPPPRPHLPITSTAAQPKTSQAAPAPTRLGSRFQAGGGGAGAHFRQTPPQAQQAGRGKAAAASPAARRGPVVERLEGGQRVQVRLLDAPPQEVLPGRGRLRGREMVGPAGGPRRHAQTVEPGPRVGRRVAGTTMDPDLILPLRTSGSPSLGPGRSQQTGGGSVGPTGSLPLRSHAPGAPAEAVCMSLSPTQRDRIRTAMEAQMVAGRQRGGGIGGAGSGIHRVPVEVDALQLPPTGISDDGVGIGGSAASASTGHQGLRPLSLPGHAATLHSWGGGGGSGGPGASVFLCIHPQHTEHTNQHRPPTAQPQDPRTHPLPLLVSDGASAPARPGAQEETGGGGGPDTAESARGSKGAKGKESAERPGGAPRPRERDPRVYGGGRGSALTPNPFAPEGRRRRGGSASPVHPPGSSTVTPLQAPASSVLIRKLRAQQRRGPEGGVSPSRRARSPLRASADEQTADAKRQEGAKQGNEGRGRALERIAEADERGKDQRVSSPLASLPILFADAPSEATRRGAERRFRRLIPGASATVHVYGGSGKAPESQTSVPPAVPGRPRRLASPSPTPPPAASSASKETKTDLLGAPAREKGRGGAADPTKEAAKAADRRKYAREPPPARGRNKQPAPSRGTAAAGPAGASGRGGSLKDKERVKGGGAVPKKDTIPGAVLRAVRGGGGGEERERGVSVASRSSRAPSASGAGSRAGVPAKNPPSPGVPFPFPAAAGVRRGGRGRGGTARGGRSADLSRQAGPPVPAVSRSREVKRVGEAVSSSSSATAPGGREKENEREGQRKKGSVGGTVSGAGLSLLKHGREEDEQVLPLPEPVSVQRSAAQEVEGGAKDVEGVAEEGTRKKDGGALVECGHLNEEEKGPGREMYKQIEEALDNAVDAECGQRLTPRLEGAGVVQASETANAAAEAAASARHVAVPPAMVIPLQALQQRLGLHLSASFQQHHQPHLNGRTDTILPARSTHNPDGRPSPLPSPAQSPGASPPGGVPPIALPLSSSTINPPPPQARASSVFPHYDLSAMRMWAGSVGPSSLSSRLPADSSLSASHAHPHAQRHLLQAALGHPTGGTPVPYPSPLTHHQHHHPLQAGPLCGSTAVLSTVALHSLVPQQQPQDAAAAAGRMTAYGGPHRIPPPPQVPQIHQNLHFLQQQGPPVTHRDSSRDDARSERDRAAAGGDLPAALQLASPRRPVGPTRRTDGIPPRPVPPERQRAVGLSGVLPSASAVGMSAGDFAFLCSQGGGEKVSVSGERSGALTARAARSNRSVRGGEEVWQQSLGATVGAASDSPAASASSALQKGAPFPSPSPFLNAEGRVTPHLLSNSLSNGSGGGTADSSGIAGSSVARHSGGVQIFYSLTHQQQQQAHNEIPPVVQPPFLPSVSHWHTPHHYPQQQQQAVYTGKGQWQPLPPGAHIVGGRFSTPDGRGGAHPAAGQPVPAAPGQARTGAGAYAVPMPNK